MPNLPENSSAGYPAMTNADPGGDKAGSDVANADPDTGNLCPGNAESSGGQRPELPFWRRCPVTTAFVVLIVLFYGLTTYASGFQRPGEAALRWGAFIPEAIRAGEWWRYFTVALLHADPAHLLINAFMTVAFGSLLEPVLGSRRLLLLYLVSLLGSGALSYALSPPDILGIGASGIGYGLIGAYMGIILIISRRRQPEAFGRDLRGIFIFVLLFVGSNLMDPHINLWAHLGGFFSGLLFAITLAGKGSRE